MAIYHASFQIVKRSAGRSAVAAAAYRSGERLIDERLDETHDYTRRAGVDDTFIMAPRYSPDWASNRNELWNQVELGETRKNSQLARELNVALPRELSQSESTQLLKEYVQESFVDKGMVADVCIHDMKSENPHAHVMLTMREIDADGFGPKNRDWNSKEQLAEWRQGWEQKTNQHLELAGHDERIDHRSLREQGIERKPTIHLGVHASAMEKRGIQTFKGSVNRETQRLNELLEKAAAEIERLKTGVQKVVKDPKIVRDAILEHVSKHGSPLKSQAAKQQRQIDQTQKAEKKLEPERTRKGPSLGH